MIGVHPSLILAVGALATALSRGRVRDAVVLATPLLALLSVVSLASGTTLTYPFLNYPLTLLRADPLSLAFGLVFSIIAVIGAIYALHVRNPGEQVAGQLYAAGTLGVVFAGDWITLFVFWELMAVSSTFLVWYRRRTSSLNAGFRYLLVHAFGGNALLAGIIIHLVHGGSLAVGPISRDPLAFWLVLLGFSVNAAVVPLHSWLTDAYPEATVTGAVLMSAFTTKVGVYALIRVFSGTELLVWAGVVMALYGVVYAVLENDIRRLLAYHIVSQVGYMVAAVGMGTFMAVDGAVAHAFSHILYKALLFMGAGAVIYATGREKLTDLGGLAGAMPTVLTLYMIGAFSISGVPLFNGFISKSIVVSAAVEDGRPSVELLLTLASVGTFLHTGLKLPYFTFFAERKGLKPKRVPPNMLIAMGIASLLCIIYGVYPSLLYSRLPYPIDFRPYTADHILSVLQLLVATGIGFWLLLGKLAPIPTISLDTDWVYRKPLAVAVWGVARLLQRGELSAEDGARRFLASIEPYFENPFRLLEKVTGKTLRVSVSTARSTNQWLSRPYDADEYRLPVGVTVFGIVLFLVVLVALNT